MIVTSNRLPLQGRNILAYMKLYGIKYTATIEMMSMNCFYISSIQHLPNEYHPIWKKICNRNVNINKEFNYELMEFL